MTDDETNHYAPCIAQITNKTRSSVKELDPEVFFLYNINRMNYHFLE